MFQSAPRSFDQGDDWAAGGFNRNRCFNPRPGLSTRATHPISHLAGSNICFNPRPGLSTRATRILAIAAMPQPGFNPRPGLSTRATEAQMARDPIFVFQSAPRSFDQGDCGPLFRLGCKTFILLWRETANMTSIKIDVFVNEQRE